MCNKDNCCGNHSEFCCESNKVYDLLVQEANDIGWPQHYKNDLLVHDKNRLNEEDAPKFFGWVLRQCGTEIIDPRMSKDLLEGFIAHYRLNGARHLFYMVETKGHIFDDGPFMVACHFDNWCEALVGANEKYHAPPLTVEKFQAQQDRRYERY